MQVITSIKQISLYGIFFGIIGTSIGGIIGSSLNLKSKKFICFILELTSGLMTSIICFDLIPEALKITNITLTIIGLLLGIFSMIICNTTINHITHNKSNLKNNHLLKTGIVLWIGLTLHNFPEGIAIGAGFDSSNLLGFKLALAIALHDVPEGISISLPLNSSGISKSKSILITTISGLSTGIGAFCGAIIGTISSALIGLSLAFAAGAMLYIVSCELIPESKNLYKGKFSSIGNIIGIIIGILCKSL